MCVYEIPLIPPYRRQGSEATRRLRNEAHGKREMAAGE